MNIKLVKLVSGEEIICELEEKEDKVILKQPISVVAVPQDDGEGIGVGFTLPWFLCSGEKEHIISKNHILCSTDPPIEMVNTYNSHFGSGIVTATQMPDIPNIQL